MRFVSGQGQMIRRRVLNSVIAAVAFVTASAPIVRSAQAAGSPFRVIVSDSGWTTSWGYSNSGKLMCLMDVYNPPRTQYLMIKWFQGNDRIVFQAYKKTWRIPSGTSIHVELGFDRNAFATATAFGGMNKSGQKGMVEFYITDMTLAVDFIKKFRDANQMLIKFPDGNETPWVANMTGSRAVGIAFSKCVASLKDQPTWPPSPSQPYGNAPTQPFNSAAPTQPFANAVPTNPPLSVGPKLVPTIPMRPANPAPPMAPFVPAVPARPSVPDDSI
jgi:hypothetical protein